MGAPDLSNSPATPANVKKKQKPSVVPKDTPATRKRRLQLRLRELSDKSERELAALMKSVNKVKSSFGRKKPKSKA